MGGSFPTSLNQVDGGFGISEILPVRPPWQPAIRRPHLQCSTMPKSSSRRSIMAMASRSSIPQLPPWAQTVFIFRLAWSGYFPSFIHKNPGAADHAGLLASREWRCLPWLFQVQPGFAADFGSSCKLTFLKLCVDSRRLIDHVGETIVPYVGKAFSGNRMPCADPEREFLLASLLFGNLSGCAMGISEIIQNKWPCLFGPMTAPTPPRPAWRVGPLFHIRKLQPLPMPFSSPRQVRWRCTPTLSPYSPLDLIHQRINCHTFLGCYPE